MFELAEELIKRGHIVSVITSWPKYNLDQRLMNRSFMGIEDENGIRVIRVKTLPHHNVNYLLRALAQLVMPFQFIYKLSQLRINVDAVVVYSPPLPLALVGVWLKSKSAKFILNVQDLFPQNAIDLGILKNSCQIKLFRALERYAYTNSNVITVHSEGNRQSILKEYPLFETKINILHNWVDIEHHRLKKNISIDFRKKWDLNVNNIAIFAGVMGPSQNLELILSIAKNLRDEKNLLFLLVGDGIERSRLETLAFKRGITNVKFKNFISREDYPDLLKICSIGLVCLSPHNSTPVVPGKILGYMASALPIAAFLHSQSDGHHIIRESNCGVSACSNDLTACTNAMKSLLSRADRFAIIGQSGLAYAETHFSKDVCVSKLENMLFAPDYLIS